MLLGFLLFWVGAVLTLNGLWLMGKIDDREIVVIDVVSGVVAGAVVLHDAFGSGATAATVRDASITLMFATTYFWVAYNRVVNVDGRGLGWFSLFVAITLIPVTLRAFAGASTVTELWLAMNWLVWAGLWIMYFLLLALKKPIQRQAAWATVMTGVLTGWLPGFLLMDGLL